MFTANDFKQFKQKGIELEQIETQLGRFISGFPYLDIVRPASAGDGITQCSKEQVDGYVQSFDQKLVGKSRLKFVPASGAATRMFKSHFEYFNGTSAQPNQELKTFFEQLPKFAFFHQYAQCLAQQGINAQSVSKTEMKKALDVLLNEPGLNYGNLPKALISFHKYDSVPRTSFEEHLVEMANYGNAAQVLKIHLTVSPEHQPLFEKLAAKASDEFGRRFGVQFDISFSVQKSSTDTIAVDSDNLPFRNNNGTILFRPGGHGALLENLNEVDADIIFIKNIDNVVPETLLGPTIKYKKLLASRLVELQNQAFAFLREMDKNTEPDTLLHLQMEDFLKNKVGMVFPAGYENRPIRDKQKFLRDKLDRPLRVCGMVKNVGEPGGGPFWVRQSDGSISLQIVESSQIDMKNPAQKALFEHATHFNPVDLACAVKNYKGEKFNLLRFRDDNAGFISVKSKDGRDLKALELPGLWNGAMSDWNTAFVEVPIETFNPVKSVNDLLRDEHQ